MRKLILLLLIFLSCFTLTAFHELEDSVIVHINNDRRFFLNHAMLDEDGEFALELAGFWSLMKYEVEWNGEEASIRVSNGEETYIFYVNELFCEKNGETRTFEKAVYIKDGRSFIPQTILEVVFNMKTTTIDYNEEDQIINSIVLAAPDFVNDWHLSNPIRPDSNGFNFYLVDDDKPLFSKDDFLWYDWENHMFALPSGLLEERLNLGLKTTVPLEGLEFYVSVDGEDIYKGIFWTAYSSFSPPDDNMPRVDVTSPQNWEDYYTDTWGERSGAPAIYRLSLFGDDRIYDQRIYNVLQRDGLLLGKASEIKLTNITDLNTVYEGSFHLTSKSIVRISTLLPAKSEIKWILFDKDTGEELNSWELPNLYNISQSYTTQMILDKGSYRLTFVCADGVLPEYEYYISSTKLPDGV